MSQAKTKVMIVEDDALTALGLQARLEGLGYAVSALSGSAEEALRAAEREPPEVVLMDIRLPGAMDGVEAARRLQDRFDLAVIYLTAYADPLTLGRAKQTAPFGYLVKPIGEREMDAAIQTALCRAGVEARLKESERRFRELAEFLPLAVAETDPDLRLSYNNQAWQDLLGPPPAGADLRSLFGPAMFGPLTGLPERLKGEAGPARLEAVFPGGQGLLLAQARTGRLGFEGLRLCLQDVGEVKREAAQPPTARRDLKKALLAKGRDLQATDRALKVLLARLEDQDREKEQNLLASLTDLVLPLLDRLAETGPNAEQKALLDLIRLNLQEAVFPLARRLASWPERLTPAEIQMADLIRRGKTTKEIARLLKVSPDTVSFHRRNIRAKLGLVKKKINLAGHLNRLSRDKR